MYSSSLQGAVADGRATTQNSITYDDYGTLHDSRRVVAA